LWAKIKVMNNKKTKHRVALVKCIIGFSFGIAIVDVVVGDTLLVGSESIIFLN
jgi:hypothetical protein